ncbi:hypothetical protein CR194_06660 [Salipaludibacillus keqinensis]|uniref:HPr domain-containing protein n=1 Tax=Salipaludibacillus keqinensis TaxID=2045207 RepID=A0A323TJB5_9BACI|nr:HPr family phosphocarrier protein [Salipaludibacillus keqinensis]PYZ95192.1 hypothetical protein CR194_06660 [Salipaludibacillus keqinensis]
MKITKELRLQELCTITQVLALVHASSEYTSDVYIYKNNTAYNSKCVLGLVNGLIGMKQNETITVVATGEDAEEAVSHLTHLIDRPPTVPGINTPIAE